MKIKCHLKKIKMSLTRRYMQSLCSVYKTQNKVVFVSFAGKQYSDNPRAVSEKLHEKYPDYEIVWGMRDPAGAASFMPDYVKTVRVSSREFYRELSGAVAYVTNCGLTRHLYKNERCLYIQTWHGDRALKKIVYDSIPDDDGTINGADKDYADIYVAGSEFGQRLARTAFRYTGKVLNTGSPRNDILVENDPEKRNRIKKTLGVDKNTKILLFAPTFRDNLVTEQNVDVDLDDAIKHLSSKGDDWVCMVRAHSASHGLNIHDKRIIDVSDYPDMADLLLVADMLFTDYSSSAGDYVLTDRPVILTQYDRADYEHNFREMYFRMEDTGFIIASDQKELDHILDTYTAEDYKASCKKVREFYGINETGRSAEDICDLINEKYNSIKTMSD